MKFSFLTYFLAFFSFVVFIQNSKSEPHEPYSIKSGYNIILHNKITEYGPLSIDNRRFYYKNNIFLFKAINFKKQELFIAVDCKNTLLSVSTENYSWTDWFNPLLNFEKSIISDFCT